MQYFDCPWSNFAIAEWQSGTRLKWWMEILVLYILDLELLLDISFTNSTVWLSLGYWLLHISLQGCNHEFCFRWAQRIMYRYTFGSMTSLLTHTVAHYTRPSLSQQPALKKVFKSRGQLSKSCQKLQNSDLVNFLCQKLSESF